MASSPRHRPTPVWTLPFPSGDPPPPGLWVQRHLAQCPLPGRTRDSTRKEEQTRAPSPRAAYRGFCHSPEPHQPGREGRATHWISRNARFSTSFTLYLRLNLQEGRERSVASKPTKCRGGRFPEALTPRCSPGDPHLALSRGSIMFLFWKLLKRSRRILPSGCGTQRGRPQLGGGPSWPWAGGVMWRDPWARSTTPAGWRLKRRRACRAWGSSSMGRAQTNRARGPWMKKSWLQPRARPKLQDPWPWRGAQGHRAGSKCVQDKTVLSFKETCPALKGRKVGPGPQRLLWDPAGRAFHRP